MTSLCGIQGGVPRSVTSFLSQLWHIICLSVGSSPLTSHPTCLYPTLPKIPLSIPPRTPLPLPSTSRRRLLMSTEKYCRSYLFLLPSFLLSPSVAPILWCHSGFPPRALSFQRPD